MVVLVVGPAALVAKNVRIWVVRVRSQMLLRRMESLGEKVRHRRCQALNHVVE